MRGTAIKYKNIETFAPLLRSSVQTQTSDLSTRYSTASLASFPSHLIGSWKRDEFDNILTFTSNSIRSSTQSNALNLLNVSGDSYTLIRSDDRTFTITIKSVNDNIEISGGTGTGQGNWNGIWRKQ